MGFLAFPQIDVSAVSVGLVRPLQLWYGARATDCAGRGVIYVSAVGGHLSPASRQRAVHCGDGVFWRLAGRRVFLFSAARVAQALQIHHVSAAYRAPSVWLRDRSLCTVCAQAFLDGIAVLRDGRPTAVATMAQLAGRSTRTIRRWLAHTQLGRIINVVLLEQVARIDDGRHVSKRSRDGQIMRIEYDGGVWLARRLPNSLEVRRRRLRKWATLRRVNARQLTSQNGDPGHQLQRYVMPGRRRPHGRLHPIAQDTAYSFHSRLQIPEPVQLWLSPRSPNYGWHF